MNLLKSNFSVASAVALAAGILAWFYLHGREMELLRRGKMTRVVAAGRYLPAYSRIRPADLSWREIPSEYLVKGYVTRAQDAQEQLSLVAFNEGEPLTYNK